MLEVHCRGIFVHTVRTAEDLDYEGVYRISAQPFARWSGFADDQDVPLQEAECYIYKDPCFLDVLAVCGARVDTRSLFRVWQTRPSDVEGCINMHNPRPLAPRMALGHVSIPVLCLIDAWWHRATGVRSVGPHTRRPVRRSSIRGMC